MFTISLANNVEPMQNENLLDLENVSTKQFDIISEVTCMLTATFEHMRISVNGIMGDDEGDNDVGKNFEDFDRSKN